MFSYYGSKSKIVHLYPKPKYGRIIEPFAGSARYALRYPDNEVTLLEIDPTIAGIWKWLIKDATEGDIRQLPDLERGDDLRDFKQLSDVERDLLGFCAHSAVAVPGNIVSSRAASRTRNGRIETSECFRFKKRALLNLPRIRHWKIIQCCYTKYKVNREYTWFIDPPYQSVSGSRYRYSAIDYESLGRWCKTRRGQVIVCEGRRPDWLPFKPLRTRAHGTRYPLIENVYIQESEDEG